MAATPRHTPSDSKVRTFPTNPTMADPYPHRHTRRRTKERTATNFRCPTTERRFDEALVQVSHKKSENKSYVHSRVEVNAQLLLFFKLHV